MGACFFWLVCEWSSGHPMLYVDVRRCDSLGSPLVGELPSEAASGPCDAARACPCCTGRHVAEEDELAMA